MTDVHDELIGSYTTQTLSSAATGTDYRLFTADFGDAPETLVVATDANIVFATAVQLISGLHLVGLVPDLRLVGVGYAGATSVVETIGPRSRDLTPCPTEWQPQAGGGPQFARCVIDEILPMVSEHWSGDAADLVYFGHSFGGLFGVDLLLSGSSPFGKYILGSPSLWWGPYEMTRREAAFAETHDDLVAEVYTAIGGWETDEGRRRESVNLPEGHPMKAPPIFLDMVADLDAFTESITGREYPSLSWTRQVIENEVHIAAGPVVLTRGLRHFYGDRNADTP